MVGVWQLLIELAVSRDKLEVHAVICSTTEEIQHKKQTLVAQLTEELNRLGVVYGRGNIDECIKEGAELMLVASGRAPVTGKDRQLQYDQRSISIEENEGNPDRARLISIKKEKPYD